MPAYYNEIEPFKAEYLRVLIRERVIADGEVDERSIEQVEPKDLRGFTQCHFFAGIGVWSYALRLAGWPDDRPVWTGSCPCPSFSAAGKGKGFDDPRHLWPAWFGLIRECRPATVFGEQVDAAIGHGWLDLVQADLEGEAYAVGKAVLGASSAGAPHRRQRLYFVGDGLAVAKSGFIRQPQTGNGRGSIARGCEASGVGLADTKHAERGPEREKYGDSHRRDGLGRSGEAGELGDANREGLPQRERERRIQPGPMESCEGQAAISGSYLNDMGLSASERLEEQELRQMDEESEQRFTAGFWRDAEWLWCRDGKYRPVEPGSFPLAHGIAGRVGLLRAYGDCIVPQGAQAFIEAYVGARDLNG